MKKKLQNFLLEVPGFQSLCRVLTRKHIRTLMYHRFSEKDDGDPRFVDRASLVAQAAYIKKHHLVIHPRQHLESLKGRQAGGCPAAVTVDDGYADFHDIAFPVFSEHSIPAMLFVTTGFVSGDVWFWWDQLAHVLDNAGAGIHQVKGLGDLTEVDLSSVDSRHASWHLVADRCRFMGNSTKEDVIKGLAADLGVEISPTPPSRFAASNWEQIQQMDRQGIPIGAHTVNHPILTRLPEKDAETEISGSQTILEKELGHPVRLFCYPQGGPADYNPRIRDMVGKYFDGCFVAFQDMDNPLDPFSMPRYCVTGDMTHFKWVLCGAEYLGLITKKRLGLSTGTTDTYWSGSPGGKESHE